MGRSQVGGQFYFGHVWCEELQGIQEAITKMRDAAHCPGLASPEARALFECKYFIRELLPGETGREEARPGCSLGQSSLEGGLP